MIDQRRPQVQPGERSCQFDLSLSPWLWHGLSPNSPFKMEIMSKPSIFWGLKRHCAKKTKSANWMVPRPQAHPSPLHWAAAKVSDKREVSLPRPPEERQTTWPAMGGFWELMFLKEAGEGVLSRSRSPGMPHNCSCPSWLQPRHSFLKNTCYATAAKIYSTSTVAMSMWHWHEHEYLLQVFRFCVMLPVALLGF